jgi:hypothetical protein
MLVRIGRDPTVVRPPLPHKKRHVRNRDAPNVATVPGLRRANRPFSAGSGCVNGSSSSSVLRSTAHICSSGVRLEAAAESSNTPTHDRPVTSAELIPPQVIDVVWGPNLRATLLVTARAMRPLFRWIKYAPYAGHSPTRSSSWSRRHAVQR